MITEKQNQTVGELEHSSPTKATKVIAVAIALVMALTLGVGITVLFGGRLPIGGPGRRAPADIDSALVGSWDFLDHPYYIFHEDGTGQAIGSPILWSANRGVLYICWHAQHCHNIGNCPQIYRWHYALDGDLLTLRHAVFHRQVFVYNRTGTPSFYALVEVPDDVTFATVDFLIGAWNWENIEPYFVFHENGTGNMAGQAVLWSFFGNTLYICTTPGQCGSMASCHQPDRWQAYITADDELILASRQIEHFVLRYARG